MDYTLSNGSLEMIMSGGVYDKPVIQVLGIKKIEGSGNDERYRLQLSDGKHFHGFAILATHLNHKLYTGELSLFSVVQINEFVPTVLKNNNKGAKKMIIVLDINIIARGSEVGKRLGIPQPWKEIGLQASATGVSLPTPVKPTTVTPTSAIPTPAIPTPATPRTPATPTPVTPFPVTSTPVKQSPVTPTASTSHAINSSVVDSKFTIPIASLAPYQNKWCIKVLVIKKSEVKTYMRDNKGGKYFKLDLCDDSGEIGATAFNKECDKFFNKIELDRVYYIGSCQIKMANKKFNKLKNDYELMFTSDTVVAECFENPSTMPTVQYEFVPISDIANKTPNTILDVIGVCKSSDLSDVTVKSTGKIIKKSEVVLVDQSYAAVTLILWGNEGENFDASHNPVIAVKGARLAEFNGSKSLSCLGSTMLRTNPDLPDAHRLRGWYDHGGASAELVNISARGSGPSVGRKEWITLKEAQTRITGNGEQGEYYNSLGVLVSTFADSAVYKACPQDNCNKKIADKGNGQYLCEKCGREYTDFKYRLRLGGTISDPTGDYEFTAFNEVTESILGKSAEEVGRLLENDKTEYGRLFDQVNFKTFLFNLRSKAEIFHNVARVQTTVMSAQPIDYKYANFRFIKSIKALSGIQV